jgi:hypothetical protein
MNVGDSLLNFNLLPTLATLAQDPDRKKYHEWIQSLYPDYPYSRLLFYLAHIPMFNNPG